MAWTSAEICVECWLKLKGPAVEPVRVLEEAVGLKPCSLCEKPGAPMIGIYVRLWLEKEPEEG